MNTSTSLSPPGADLDGLVESLEKWARVEASEDAFVERPEDTLYFKAASAIRSLLALRERVEGELATERWHHEQTAGGLKDRAAALYERLRAAESSLTRRPDATDLFEAFEASLVEGTPSLALQCGRIWIDAEAAFDARAFIDGLFAHAEAAEARSSQLEAELQEAIELIRRCERRLDAVEGLNRSALRMHLQTVLSKSLPRAALQPQEGGK